MCDYIYVKRPDASLRHDNGSYQVLYSEGIPSNDIFKDGIILMLKAVPIKFSHLLYEDILNSLYRCSGIKYTFNGWHGSLSTILSEVESRLQAPLDSDKDRAAYTKERNNYLYNGSNFIGSKGPLLESKDYTN